MRTKHSTTRNLRLSPDYTRYSTAKQQKTPKRDFFATSTALWGSPILCQGFRRRVVPSHTAHLCYSLHWPLFEQTAGKSYRCHRLKNLFQLVHVHPSGCLRIHRLRQCPSLLPLPTLASRSTWRRLTQRVQAKPNASLPEICHLMRATTSCSLSLRITR